MRRAFSEPLNLRHTSKELVPDRKEGTCQLLGTVHVLSASEGLSETDEDLKEIPRKVDTLAEIVRRLEAKQAKCADDVAEIRAMLVKPVHVP